MQTEQPSRTTHTWQRVSFPNSLGQNLAGLFYGYSGVPVILVICHGFSGSKEGGGRALEMAEYLARPELGFLLFDFSGNGESEGEFSRTTLSGQMEDLSRAIDWCQENGAQRILGMGRSFGGTTLLCQAARDTRIEALCTWAAASDPLSVFKGFVVQREGDWVTFAGEEAYLQMRKEILEELEGYDILNCARSLAPRHLTIIHGERDELIPPHQARRIHEAHPQSKLHMVPGADHRFQTGLETVWSLCLQWLNDILGPEQAGREDPGLG